MSYFRTKAGKHHLVEKVRGLQKVLAYLGEYTSLPEAIDGLAAELAVQRSIATVMARRARAARRRYPDGWLRDGKFPPPWYAMYVAPGPAEILREHWDARRAADQARSRAAKLKARLDKLRAVAADLERAGAGAGDTGGDSATRPRAVARWHFGPPGPRRMRSHRRARRCPRVERNTFPGARPAAREGVASCRGSHRRWRLSIPARPPATRPIRGSSPTPSA